MHRAVLLAEGAEIDEHAVRLPDGQPLAPAASGGVAARAVQAADAAARAFVGRTVAEMEQELILQTLTHCLGNRTHAATILGISIRTLRNKLKEYSDAGVDVPAPQSGLSAA
jgi:DNA-binding NtrC family response regulator